MFTEHQAIPLSLNQMIYIKKLLKQNLFNSCNSLSPWIEQFQRVISVAAWVPVGKNGPFFSIILLSSVTHASDSMNAG